MLIEKNKLKRLIIYTKEISARQEYIFDFVFAQILGLKYVLENNIQQYLDAEGFKINYSEENIVSDITIKPHTILFETDIKAQNISVTKWNELPIFFQNENTEIPFDIFAASFYLISRYEEYLPFRADMYGRFSHKSSIAFANHFLQLPLVDLWIMELKKILVLKNILIQCKDNRLQYLPSYDIDIAYSYKGKSLGRQIGGAVKDLLKGNIAEVKNRINVLHNTKKDPYDSYDFLDHLHAKYDLKPIYFFLVAKHGTYDKNLSFESEEMHSLINNISNKYEVGLHPSFQSHEDFEILKEEKIKIKTEKSRQHYIKFQLPSTFQSLLKLGITEDYSMGYGCINGFRASTSFAFRWFDVSKNKTTALMLFPFCYMECNSFYEQHFSAKQALEEMLYYLKITKKVHGRMISIWHNFSLGTDTIWHGWKEVYEDFLKEMDSQK